MSRELKFRSWNLETKFMYNNIEDGVVAKNQKGEFVLGISFGAICRDANSIVMQFTGLKDKNGKEIYEYDILSFEDFPNETIVFKYGTFGYDGIIGFNSLLDTNLSIAEVIGNIYDTPELL